MPVAAVDIGTNTVRLLIADVSDGLVTEIERLTTVTALGKGVDQSGRLSPPGVRHSLATLAGYRERIEAHGVEHIRIVATSASRDAENGPDFLAAVASTMGVEPELISGVEEARLAYAGAASAFPGTSRPLIIDIGGGSTEFVTDGEAVSIDIGSVRLTDRALPDRPALAHQVATARRMVGDLLSATSIPKTYDTVLGVAGTWTSLAAIAMDMPTYDRSRVHGAMVLTARMERIVHDLAALSLESLRLIPSLDPARAPVILAGSIIAWTTMQHLSLTAVTVSESDLLDGVALLLAKQESDRRRDRQAG